MTTGNALNANFTANQLLYASSATDLSGLATATNALLVTSAGGVPSFSATIPLLVQQNITELGTITSMAAPLNQQFGGTGVANTGTITLGGNLTTTGAHDTVFNITADTSVTFPTSGVLATTVGVGVLTVSGTLNNIACTGGQNPVLSIDPNYVGQTSITTLGTVTTGVFEGSVIGLAYGGTNANLTASNGGIFYSTATAAAILSGTSTANKVLLSGSSSAPSWSTATYPATTTANQILYSSATNTIAGLATANDGVLITSVAGVPSVSSTLPAAVQQNITKLGSISYMTTPLGSDFGGTGVDNNGATITLAGSITTTGAHTVEFNFTGDTDLTFPLSGTLATVAGIPSLPLITSQGGSGVASPTAHGILVSEGSSAFNPIVLGAGQLLIGTTAADPAATTLTAGNAITIGSVSGAITVGVTSNPTLPGTAGVTLPQGNTAAQAGAAGTMRFNTQTTVFEGTTDGATWSPFTTAASGVISVGGTTNRITSTGGTTPIIDIASTYVGQTSITTLGTIATGTWNGTAVDVTHGGTNLSSTTAYAVLCGGTTSTASLQQVSGLGTTGYVLTSNGAGALPTWQATAPTGVTSNIATTNQTTVSSATGNVTIGLASNAVLPGTAGVTLPQGNTAAQAGAAGTMRFNTQTSVFEGTNDGSTWAPFTTASTGVVSVGGTTNRITSTGGTTPIIDIASTYVGQNSITTLGTITTGTWGGSIVGSSYGGTGIDNNGNTLTLGGNLTTSGGFNTTLTVTGNTSVTVPTSGTLVNTAVTTLSSLASVGTITSGTWNGSIVTPIYGGTGVNNGSNTITLAGSLTTLGAYNATFTMTGATNVTFPTSGTLAISSDIPTFPLSLANGGLNANLTASNGGIFYSTGSAGAILSGTTTANQVLLSGSSTTPAWSTATYPATTTVNEILYSSSSNTIAGLTTANNGVLVTGAGGVPSIGSTLPAAVQGNITSTGTITSGAWNGTIISPTYGGTGINNGAYTITLGGSISTAGGLTLSGNYTSTFTFTNNTAVTFPVSGTLVNSAVATLSSLASIGTITTGTWNGTAIGVTYGGTNLTSFNQGDILYASAANTLMALGKDATATRYLANTGTTNNPAWDQINLANGITGTLPVANGGTGIATTTAYSVMCAGTTATGAFQSLSSLGTSGEVLTSNGAGALPTWQAAGGGGGGGITWQSVQTSNFNATTGNGYPVNTTSSVITATLPASPTAGNIVLFTDYAGTFATNNLTLDPNGNKINGLSYNTLIQNSRESIELIYIDSTQGWIPYSGFNTVTPMSVYSASYLVIAGGGGGGGGNSIDVGGGGGGAGGLLTGTASVQKGTVYSITVGGGGAGGPNGGKGSTGTNSVLSGSNISTITASGGGGAGGDSSGGTGVGSNGSNGGSGGAATRGGTVGSGTAGQGYAGGLGYNNTRFPGGGGGGAGGVGSNYSSANVAGNGGAGASSSITGTAVSYAGGGGGGISGGTAGTATDGGGNGSTSSAGSAGTAYLGGGGGGGFTTGGNGGTGVVILSVLTSAYSGTTTGTPTVTTSGSYTIIKFTTSGTYTA